VFQFGLVLAGAISAGAYTAGVLDFLFQALSEWEKERGKEGVPDHRVVLKVIAGASAGAISGALGAVALARGLLPREFSTEELENTYPDHYGEERQKYSCVLPSLHRTWVVLPAMARKKGDLLGDLLGTGDFALNSGVRSLLDASVLDLIKQQAIQPLDEQNGKPLAGLLPYVAERLHVYSMISNMRGIPYEIQFGNGTTYGMQTVGDRVHYVVSGVGSTDISDPASWVERDAAKASIGISTETLPLFTGADLKDWERYGDTALASGAFPIGLASRNLQFGWPHYLDRLYPVEMRDELAIRPAFPAGLTGLSDVFRFETVDGGLVNNNPFDYAQFALIGKASTGPTDGTSVKRANIMVAPFPEPPKFPSEGSPSPALTAIARALLPTLLNQARFRASDLAPAVDERDFSRFLIAPLRRKPRTDATQEQTPLERYAIACGLLGGFGGFLDETFRNHDFQLGRRNCQHFLRKSFRVEGDNVIVGKPGQTEKVQVIPLLGTAVDAVPLPRWPQIDEDAFAVLRKRMTARIDAIVPRLLRSEISNGGLRKMLRVGWRLLLRKRLIAFVEVTMRADLVRRRQMAGWDVCCFDLNGRKLEDAQEVVVAALVNTKSGYRIPKTLSGETHLPEEFVTRVLEHLRGENADVRIRLWRDEFGYLPIAQQPGFIKNSRPVRWLRRSWRNIRSRFRRDGAG
jgi:hypothetical protein